MMILAETLWKLVPEQLDDNMREVMAKIEDGPRRDHDEVWAEILAAAPTQDILKEALERNEKLADIAIDLDKQFISAAGEIASLRLALITMSMLDADSEQLKETAQRILDRSRERWPPEHKPFTSIAILEGRSIMNHKYLAPLTDGISDREAVTRADAAALVHRFEMESMALHKTQREWLVHEITALTLQDGNQP